MGWLDQLFWSPDKREERSHQCDYAIVERNGYSSFDTNSVDTGLEVHYARNVVIECQSCGETHKCRDYNDCEKRVITWDYIEEMNDDEIKYNNVHSIDGVRVFTDVADQS